MNFFKQLELHTFATLAMNTMKILLLFLTTFWCALSFGQSTMWHELPQNPLNPNAGTVSPGSYDLIMSDDGTPYAAFIQYDGVSNYTFFIDQYVAGTGWTNVHQETAYGGFQIIHSYKIGASVYVSARLDNAGLNPTVKVFKINAGTVALVQSQAFNSIGNGDDYDFVVSENEQYAYYCYQDLGGLLRASQLNLSTANFYEISIPAITNSMFHDIVEHQDTLYVAFSDYVGGNYSSKLYKSSVSFTGFQPYQPAVSNGVIPGSTTISPVEFFMSFNSTQNKISVLAKGSANNQLALYDPSNGSIVTSATNLIPSSNSRTAASYDASGEFFFNQVYDGVSAAVEAQVLSLHPTLGTTTVVGNFNFNGVQSQSSHFRLKHSTPNHRHVAQYYDVMASSTRNYMSNEGPSLTQAVPAAVVCPSSYQKLFTIDLQDLNFDNLNIFNITSTDVLALDPATIVLQYNYSSGNIDTYSLFGTTGASGNYDLTLSVTDGWDTAYITLPTQTIQTISAPSFTQNPIYLCSADGQVDMFQYVTTNTGFFAFNGSTEPLPSSIVNTTDGTLATGTFYSLVYKDSTNGCLAAVSSSIFIQPSPTTTLVVDPTDCGLSNGLATATIAGGTAPYSDLAWSTGETNTYSIANLAAGIYTFEYKDANGCKVLNEFAVQNNNVSITPTVVQPTCFGGNDGSISLAVTGTTGNLSILWSSGHSAASISGITAGTYTVQVSDMVGCVLTSTVVVGQPEPFNTVISPIQPTCGNADGSIQIITATGGTGTLNYSWSNGMSGTSISGLSAGIYSVLIEDQNTCQTTKTVYLSEQGSANLTGSIQPTSCGEALGAINVTPFLSPGLSVQSISWSNGATSEDISGLASNNYVCTLVASNGCTAIKGWNIPIVEPQVQPICVISVDSTTSTNLVVWEKVQPLGIAYYNIYRETSNQGEYILIDTVHHTNISLFNDVVASPMDRSWSYKISAVNACGVEGNLSLPHRTMHLSTYEGIGTTKIQWNAYEGAVYSSFSLWRYTPANGWELIASLPVSQTTYEDPISFQTPGLDYMVEFSLDQPCTATLYKAQDFNTTRSNRDKGAFSAGSGTGNSNNALIESVLNETTVAPNPTTGDLYINCPIALEGTVSLLGLNGQLLLQQHIDSTEQSLDISFASPGVYFVKIAVEGNERMIKIIKQ